MLLFRVYLKPCKVHGDNATEIVRKAFARVLSSNLIIVLARWCEFLEVGKGLLAGLPWYAMRGSHAFCPLCVIDSDAKKKRLSIMPNVNLNEARNARMDEFYTQREDIEREVNAYLEYDPDTFRNRTVLLPCDDPEWSNFTNYFALHFEDLGLKKLISTSYAPDSKMLKVPQEPTLFETESPQFDPKKAQVRGKKYILDRDVDGNGRIDINDLKWDYLDGDGDFQSDEVKALRDEADIIVTNPPFSLFREFFAWIMEGGKKFLIIGSMNAITYKELFPQIKNNQVWLGNGFQGGNAYFGTPIAKKYASGVYDENTGLVKFRNCCWLTNLEHGRRHQPLPLMSMHDNLKFSRHKELKGKNDYEHYDNYDAIEVPYTDAIPSDYEGVMGVPISFLNKYCPEQFEILGEMVSTTIDEYNFGYPYINGKKKYARIVIRKKQK